MRQSLSECREGLLVGAPAAAAVWGPYVSLHRPARYLFPAQADEFQRPTPDGYR